MIRLDAEAVDTLLARMENDRDRLVAELEADPHGVFRAWRPRLPFVGHEIAGVLILRARDVDLIPEENQKTLTPADRAAAVVVGVDSDEEDASAVPLPAFASASSPSAGTCSSRSCRGTATTSRTRSCSPSGS